MINEFFQEIFRIVAFGAFVALVTRGVIKSIIPTLATSFTKYKKVIADKIKLREKFDQDQQEVIKEREMQRVQGLKLSEKIAFWSSQEHAKIVNENQEILKARERLLNYMVEQSRSLAVLSARKELMPEINAQATQTIKTFYSDVTQQKKYMTSMLQSVESDHHE